MATNLEVLRQEVLKAVNEVFERYGWEPSTSTSSLVIRWIEKLSRPLVFRWPEGVETFKDVNVYDIEASTGTNRVAVAKTIRNAWGKDRGRIVVFGKHPSAGEDKYYPWAEFVEADDGSYTSGIPDPSAPRSLIKDGDELPAEVRGQRVRRTDECFASVKSGQSLRLVLDRNEEEAMIRHAYWVAKLRGRIS